MINRRGQWFVLTAKVGRYRARKDFQSTSQSKTLVLNVSISDFSLTYGSGSHWLQTISFNLHQDSSKPVLWSICGKLHFLGWIIRQNGDGCSLISRCSLKLWGIMKDFSQCWLFHWRDGMNFLLSDPKKSHDYRFILKSVTQAIKGHFWLLHPWLITFYFCHHVLQTQTYWKLPWLGDPLPWVVMQFSRCWFESPVQWQPCTTQLLSTFPTSKVFILS